MYLVCLDARNILVILVFMLWCLCLLAISKRTNVLVILASCASNAYIQSRKTNNVCYIHISMIAMSVGILWPMSFVLYLVMIKYWGLVTRPRVAFNIVSHCILHLYKHAIQLRIYFHLLWWGIVDLFKVSCSSRLH